jgi:hypothetical protein
LRKKRQSGYNCSNEDGAFIPIVGTAGARSGMLQQGEFQIDG